MRSFSSFFAVATLTSAAFAAPLQVHLAAEIPTLENLRVYADNPKLDLMKMAEEAAQNSMGAGMMFTTMPALLLNHDRTFEGGFEDNLWPKGIPWAVSWTMRKALTSWYWGWWKFSACDASQMPRELVYMDLPDRVEG